MQAAVLEYGIAIVAGEMTVYNYDGETREYLSATSEYLPVGVGLPANACTDEPLKARKGFAVCRSPMGDSWEYLSDYRGKTVWSTGTGDPVNVTSPGDYPEGTTTQAPETPYDRWDGEKWVTDEDARKADAIKTADLQKSALIQAAGESISPLQDAVDLGMATEEEKSRYDAWRKYRVLLTRVDILQYPEIVWPEKPI
ncbi:tail fiber assembly protein [Lelliottia nimipressuralis]|uniref:Tail fiber assembly protein n=1 Tax=Lelliottia nimipressuralis TaxID=69220 RepID=A0ABD4KAZ0_9ENTR|nr:tail fiber assembly protein [Lelliottia nimipressuralis]MBF4178979.1 tail fiber assembly protein [Lelliottia nimipressuralis]